MNANANANTDEKGKLAAAVAEENAEGKRTADVESRILTNTDGKPFGVEFIFGGDRSRRIEISYHNLTDDMRILAALHGLKQKIGDGAAISRNPENGKSATAEDKFAACREIADRILEGSWNKRRTAGGGAGGLLLRAMLRMFDGRMDEGQVKAWLDSKTDKEKAALRKNPEVVKHIDAIRAEDGSDAGTPGEELLAELAQLATPETRAEGKEAENA